MASGDTLIEWVPASNEVPGDWRYLPFTSGGTHEVLVGDTLTGATGGATADVVLIEVTGGTWGGGDAAGFFIMRNQSGAFESENLNEGGNGNVCTIAADSTLAAALPDNRHGVPMLTFDDTALEIAVFTAIMPQNYDGGGVTAYHHMSMATAVADEIIVSSGFQRIGEVLDIDLDSWAALQDSAASTVNGTAGIPDIVSVAFTDGAQMDSVAKGELFRYLCCRRTDLVADNATGDAQNLAVELREA